MLETPQASHDKPARPLVLWRFVDGKPGHEKQTLGLCRALGKRTSVEVHDINAGARWRDSLNWLLDRFPPGESLPRPDLLIVAGHGTHYAGLAARRAHGGRLVALMRPALPRSWFDLCLIPEHDDPDVAANVITTRGALTAAEPGGAHAADAGLILIGGPSRDYGWDDASITQQVRRIIETQPGMRWRLSTSRRTPPDLLPTLRAMLDARAQVFGPADTPTGWVETALADAGQAWVTEDSVSMLYEALTAGCHFGLLRLPRTRVGRVARGVDRLLGEGWVIPMEGWLDGICPTPPNHGFDESGRCAQLILEKWFPNAV